jgi:hypothetical protein
VAADPSSPRPPAPGPPTQASLAELEALRRERAAHEESLRAAAAEARHLEACQYRRQASVYAIQNAWKVYRKRRRAGEAKGGGGKGGAGKGGAKGATASGSGAKAPAAKGKKKK